MIAIMIGGANRRTRILNPNKESRNLSSVCDYDLSRKECYLTSWPFLLGSRKEKAFVLGRKSYTYGSKSILKFFLFLVMSCLQSEVKLDWFSTESSTSKKATEKTIWTTVKNDLVCSNGPKCELWWSMDCDVELEKERSDLYPLSEEHDYKDHSLSAEHNYKDHSLFSWT